MDGLQGSSKNRDLDLAASAPQAQYLSALETSTSSTKPKTRQIPALIIASANTPEERRIARSAFNQDDFSPRSDADMYRAAVDILAHRARRNAIPTRGTAPVDPSGSTTPVSAPLPHTEAGEAASPSSASESSSSIHDHLRSMRNERLSLTPTLGRQTDAASSDSSIPRRYRRSRGRGGRARPPQAVAVGSDAPQLSMTAAQPDAFVGLDPSAEILQPAATDQIRARRIARIRAEMALPPISLSDVPTDIRRAGRMQAWRERGLAATSPGPASRSLSDRDGSVQSTPRVTTDGVNLPLIGSAAENERPRSHVRAHGTEVLMNFRPVVWDRAPSAPSTPVSGDRPTPANQRQSSAGRAREATGSQVHGRLVGLDITSVSSGGVDVTARTAASSTAGPSTSSTREPTDPVSSATTDAAASSASSSSGTIPSPASWVSHTPTRSIVESPADSRNQISRTPRDPVGTANAGATTPISGQRRRATRHPAGHVASTVTSRPASVSGLDNHATRDSSTQAPGRPRARTPGYLAAARPVEREAIVDPSQPTVRRNAVRRVVRTTAALWRITEGIYFRSTRESPRPPSLPPPGPTPASTPSALNNPTPSLSTPSNISSHANARLPSPASSHPHPPTFPRSARRILNIPLPLPSPTPSQPEPYDAMILEADGTYTPAPTRAHPDPHSFPSETPIILSIHPSWPTRHSGPLTRETVEAFLAMLDPNASPRTTPASSHTLGRLSRAERTWNPSRDRDLEVEFWRVRFSADRQARLRRHDRDTSPSRRVPRAYGMCPLRPWEEADAPVCVICSERFRANRTVFSELPCGHLFCARCIQDWLRRNGSCPTCRARVA